MAAQNPPNDLIGFWFLFLFTTQQEIYSPKKEVSHMAKADVVQAQLAAIQTAETQAITDGLGACYDQGAVDQKASDGTLTQADLDAAVKAATDPLNAQIATLQGEVTSEAQALTDAQAQAATALVAVQKSLDDMTAKESVEEGLVTGLQNSIAAVQSSLDAIKAAVSAVLNPPAPPST